MSGPQHEKGGWLSNIPKWAFAVPLVTFAIGVLVGGWVFGGDDGDIPGPVPIDLGRPGRYVALGDSYSAGEGLEPFQEETRDIEEGGDRCHRSEQFAYPLLLEFVQQSTTVFRACSGAVVANLFNEVQGHSGVPNHQGLQVDQEIGGEDVTLVTLTMGGNDVGFAKVLNFCFSNGKEENCADQPFEGTERLRDWADARLGELKADLVDLYLRLRESFPTARILALGYPALFPLKAPPIYRDRAALCTLLFTRWTLPEREAIRNWGFGLDRVIQEATQQANENIEYVDISSHFTGHEPCSAGGEWVRFVGLFNSVVRDGSFHPLRDGQAMMARIVSCHLDVFPTADTPRTKTTNYAMTGCVAKETAELVEATAATPPITEATATPT